MQDNKKEKLSNIHLIGYLFWIIAFLGFFGLSGGGDGSWGIPASVLIYLFIIAPAYVIYLFIANILTFTKNNKKDRRKTLFIINFPLIIICILAGIGYLSDLRPLNRATIKVINEAGTPLENVQLVMRFTDNTKYYKTDVTGQVTVMGFGFGLAGWVKKEGYYNNNIRYSATPPKETVKLFWRFAYNLPWNPTIIIVLEKIINPVPLYYNSIGTSEFPGDGAGYDLIVGDWVVPHGKGKVPDFIFDRFPAPGNELGRLILRFGNKNDGLVSLSSKDDLFLIKKRFTAPTTGYKTTHQVFDISEYFNMNFDEEKKHDRKMSFFRIRTEKDSEGKIKRALYGRIMGKIRPNLGSGKGPLRVTFTYFINPMVNDKNLEFDRVKNLFKLSEK